MALNYLMPPYDDNGKFAASGQLNSKLLQRLNNLDFHEKQPPKSLGSEWFENDFLPVLDDFDCSVEDKLHTVCEHIAEQIAKVVNAQENAFKKHMLVTGGGTKNGFLMSRIKERCLCKFSKNDPLIVNFKEALIFAFLGVLRFRKEVDCLCEVTGAKHDSIGGCVYLGNL